MRRHPIRRLLRQGLHLLWGKCPLLVNLRSVLVKWTVNKRLRQNCLLCTHGMLDQLKLQKPLEVLALDALCKLLVKHVLRQGMRRLLKQYLLLEILPVLLIRQPVRHGLDRLLGQCLKVLCGYRRRHMLRRSLYCLWRKHLLLEALRRVLIERPVNKRLWEKTKFCNGRLLALLNLQKLLKFLVLQIWL